MGLREKISDWTEARVDAIGFAPVDRFRDTPETHHPSRICRDARTVIVFGNTVPRGIGRRPCLTNKPTRIS